MSGNIEEGHGFHAERTVLETDTGKIFEKRFGGRDGYGREEAVNLVDAITGYVTTANRIGVKMPHSEVKMVTLDKSPDRWAVVTKTPHVGLDLANILPFCQPDEFDQIYDQYLRRYARVMNAGMPIALDPPLANFCLDENRKLQYIDFMPPRMIRDDGSVLSELPEPPADIAPFIFDRYFGPRLPQVIYAQTVRVAPAGSFEPERVKEKIGIILGNDAYTAVSASLPTDRHLLLPTDADLLRMYAGEQKVLGRLSITDSKRVFDLTHIDPGGVLPLPQYIQEAAQIVYNIA